MTREDAIEIFEQKGWRIAQKETFTSKQAEEIIKLNDAVNFALSSLRPVSREQVERMRGEWQVCFEDWRKQMAGDQCSKCGFQHYETSTHHYKFCPACGAPMTDEAVDIIMRRLETLYETT